MELPLAGIPRRRAVGKDRRAAARGQRPTAPRTANQTDPSRRPQAGPAPAPRNHRRIARPHRTIAGAEPALGGRE